MPLSALNTLGAVDPDVRRIATEVVQAVEAAGVGAPIRTLWGKDSNPANGEHYSGCAIDFMCDRPAGDWIADYLWTHRARLGLRWVIWRQRIRNASRDVSWRGMADRGNSTVNHMDHVHAYFTGAPYVAPTGGPGPAPAPALRDAPAVDLTGRRLEPGTVVPCGDINLAMQTDGNLVVYIKGRAAWATGTDGLLGAWCQLQADGNLVVYTDPAQPRPRWQSATRGTVTRWVLQADGNLVGYGPSSAVWDSLGHTRPSNKARPVLRTGSVGADVEVLQRRLTELGFAPGQVDGRFGTRTRTAVVDFQERRGLGVDGIVGPQTWSALIG